MSSHPFSWLSRASLRRALVSSIAGLPLLVAWPTMVAAATGPTTREVVEFTRIIQPLNHDNAALQTQISPDGQHLFIVTRKGDVGSDQNRFEILLLDVSPRHLATSQAGAPVSLLTVKGERDSDDADPPLREARWVGDRTIVFRARLHDDPFQVYRLDVGTRRLEQLTFEPLGLVEFAVSDDLRRIVYVAPVANPAMPSDARSLVVGTNSFWSVHFGQKSLLAQQRRYQYRTVAAGSRTASRPLGEPFFESSGRWPGVSISPDGRWAVLPRYQSDRQLAWAEQYPQVAEATARYGPSLKLDPLSYYSRPYSYVPRRHVAYRLADGIAQVVVDAPDDSLPGGNQLRTDRIWMGGGASVVIAGTHLPQTTADAGEGRKPHVIEYWPDSGRWEDIAVLRKRLISAERVPGERDGFVVVDGAQRRRFERAVDGRWRELDNAGDGPARGDWRLRVDESLNEPPDVVAVDPGDRKVRLTRLNPQFSVASWGTMRPYGWKDAKGRPWDGGLMVPLEFDPRVRHPLVIQTYGFSASRFYLDGSNLYDGYTSGFAGRAFLREGILVLALPWGATSGGPDDEHGAMGAFSEGVQGAIDALVAEGLVDRDRIGIMGWSATGERVLNLLTFSDTPVRAATLLDGDANTMFSMTITYAVKDGIQNRKEATNEGGPFGDSLARWMRNDPSMHTDCVRAAVRIETYGPVVHNNWDIYALLRRQYKPAEMIVIPQGSHALARPSERMISMQGNVDWYRFWLSNERRSEPLLAGETATTLKDQYARWDQMLALKEAVDGKPGCVRVVGAE
jgi:dipeptidyl aminopeptidase/acylaminoacyl peptidase